MKKTLYERKNMKNKNCILVITLLALFLSPVAALAAPLSLTSPGSKAVNEGVALPFTLSASGGSTPYTYSFTSSPAATGATLNATTGAFSWTPGYTQHGSYSVTFKVTDRVSNTSSKTITITVNNVNAAPVLTSPGNKIIAENAALTFTLSATDADADTLSYSATGLPSGATLSPTIGAFSWTPSYAQAGIYTVTFTASDGKLTNSQTITITATNVNHAPVLTSPGNKTVAENAALTFTLSATDADADTLSYSATGLPSGATLSPTTGAFSWTPSYAQAGAYTITFTASDATLSSSQTSTITVTNVNRAPVLSAIGSKSVSEGATLSFSISATDPDGDTLAYFASNLPDGATFDPDTRTFSWEPGYDSAGNYQNVLFTVTDNGDPLLSDYEAITITVGNVNRPPILNPIGNKSIEEGQQLQLTVTGTDPDGNSVAYSASNLPDGATFDPDTRTFSWEPGYDNAGNYQNVLFTVTDNGDPLLSDYEAITITVGNVNRPPILNPIGNKSIEEGQQLQLTVTGTDPDGNSVAYSASNLPDGATFDPDTQTFSWEPGNGQSGNYTVHFTAVDDGIPQESASEEITITVNESIRRICIDNDQDGYGEGCELGSDCNDNDPAVHPGAQEICDSKDNDCNDTVDDVEGGCKPTWAQEVIVTVKPGNAKVTIAWAAISEDKVFGYNIFRAKGAFGSYEKINAQLIQAKGSIETTVNYEFVDEKVQNGSMYSYILEELQLASENIEGKKHASIVTVPRLIYALFPIE
ncbi:MAG: putative Ig domain-containing protein [Pseudomonadota bacterium]